MGVHVSLEVRRTIRTPPSTFRFGSSRTKGSPESQVCGDDPDPEGRPVSRTVWGWGGE